MSPRTLLIVCAFVCAAGPALAAQPIPVVNEGGIRDKWMLAEGVPLAVPAYPAEFAKRGDDVCVSVGYLVNTDGTLSDFAMMKAWNSASGTSEPEDGYWQAFAEAAGDALKLWRLRPRPEVTAPQPVYTAATFVFGAKGALGAVRQHCVVPNVAARLRELRDAQGRRAGPEILDRLDLDQVGGDGYSARGMQR